MRGERERVGYRDRYVSIGSELFCSPEETTVAGFQVNKPKA